MNDPRIEELRSLLPRCMLPDWVRLGSRMVRLLRDRLHVERHDAVLARLLEQAQASVALREQRRVGLPRVTYPGDLPITVRKDEIVAAIRANPVVVIAGETGSGKTTQIPKMCLEAGLGVEAKIGCTQPRRVAALSISRRIAEELDLAWGRGVGCKIRFDDRSSPETYIKLMTDGILLAETQGDPLLSEYNAIIIDEAHERSLNIDFLLGCLRNLLDRRKDLKLVITSATIDTQLFSRHFGDAPIIEVSGRTYPVEVLYQPLESASEEQGDVSYVDGAVSAVERVLYESSTGDILVFMPGERDIRETADQLEGRFRGEVEVIPLFGRLSSGDQQRVFSALPRRKVVVATNIAETSLTIPGIRYVVDPGLARISRYNPRTRTRRLPIEEVSQSSANQRKGRAGRVQSGVCIRLYSEEDFQARPAFTQPEIQRSNLAEVILRMKAFRLGEIETFPFVQPPAPAAISGGYALLQELGALDENRQMTRLGEDLARLPIDPTLGRMLLQSQVEHATRELLIIASGMSIQDPRERPLDQKEAAAAAHRRFTDAQSDFLTLLNIWNAVHEQWESLRTQGQRRRFCKQQFLSYLRMREWQDLHAQLTDALGDLGTLNLNESNASYEAIHRSILAGLIGHVAQRQERNLYKGVGNRQVVVFPGSALHEKGEPPRPRGARTEKAPPKPRPSQPGWLVAGEIVETSQLFIRTLGGIDPAWILQVAPHCCKISHANPQWNVHAGRVLIEEVATLHGLEVHRKKVAYANLNPKDATAIFIRAALVEENLVPRAKEPGGERDPDDIRAALARPEQERQLPAAYRFIELNRAVRQKVENWQTRVRRYDLGDLDQALFKFYAARFDTVAVASLHELNRFLGDPAAAKSLLVTEADLIGDLKIDFDALAFPDAVPVGGQPVAISYAYAPGEEHDGVTVHLPVALAQSATHSFLEWAVPGLREEKANELLRALPKSIRRELMPLPPKAAEIAAEFTPKSGSFLGDLAAFIHQRYGVQVTAAAWSADALPVHLRPRIEIVGPDRKVLRHGRDLEVLKKQMASAPVAPAVEPPAWQRAVKQWEKFAVESWSFGDLPERLTIVEDPSLPVYGWPGLQLDEGNVHVRLFRSLDLARAATPPAYRTLVEREIRRDLAWIEKDLRSLSKFDSFCKGFCAPDELRASALRHIQRHVLDVPIPKVLTAVAFAASVGTARARVPGLAQQLIDRVGPLLQLRQQVAMRITKGGTAPTAPPKPGTVRTLNDLSQLGLVVASASTAAPGSAPKPALSALGAELEALMPSGFLDRIGFERLGNLPRFLKALLIRAERAGLNPAKDAERMRLVQPYVDHARRLQSWKGASEEQRALVAEFCSMVEEYKVSLFAQELGTAMPVSPKRLDQVLERIGPGA